MSADLPDPALVVALTEPGDLPDPASATTDDGSSDLPDPTAEPVWVQDSPETAG